MIYTLDNFYTSKKWRAFVNALRLERLDDNGQLICEHCGKPIIKAYDCIGHHTIELTDENVNDYTISLNPENVELIHHKCHNIIHQRFEGFKRRVYLVYGSPCSGKSTYVNDIANADDLILDVDKIWECLSTADKYHKPNRIKANVFGVRDCIIDQIRTRTGNWRNAYIIGGYPLKSDRDRLCDMLNAMPIFIDEPKDICLSRAANEDWKEYIEEWFEDFVA